MDVSFAAILAQPKFGPAVIVFVVFVVAVVFGRNERA